MPATQDKRTKRTPEHSIRRNASDKARLRNETNPALAPARNSTSPAPHKPETSRRTGANYQTNPRIFRPISGALPVIATTGNILATLRNETNPALAPARNSTSPLPHQPEMASRTGTNYQTNPRVDPSKLGSWQGVYGEDGYNVIAGTAAPNTDQLNFPVLVGGTYPYLATAANGGRVNDPNGYDVIFASDAACKVKLNHEVELYNPTTGQIAAWVQVPFLRQLRQRQHQLARGGCRSAGSSPPCLFRREGCP